MKDGWRRELRRRYALLGSLLAVFAAGLGLAVAGLGSRFVLEAVARDETSRQAARARAAVGAWLEEASSAFEADVGVLLGEPSSVELLARAALAGRIDADQAARLARLVRSPYFAILDTRGTVLFSRHWPALAGRRSDWVGLAEGSPILRPVAEPFGERWAVLFWREQDLRGARLRLAGGRPLDLTALEAQLGPGVSLQVVGPSGEIGQPRGEARVRGRETRVSEIPLPEGLQAWRLRVFVDPQPWHVRRRQWARTLAGLGVAVLAVAAGVGFYAGRRAVAPLLQVLNGVEAVARGEADYTWLPRREVLAWLPAGFSELRRGLEAERQRARMAERAAAWRDAARHLAHELRNPLAPIRLTVENLRKARLRAPEQFEALWEEGSRAVLEEVAALERIVREFEEFARLPEPRLTPLQLDPVVDDVLALYGGRLELAVERRGGAPAPVLGDAALLSRALRNIVANAVEAVDGRGTLEVETGRRDETVFVRVRDHGPGFPQAVLAHPFIPYRTSKAEGTGLGLVLTRRIVAEHGGELRLRNHPEGGAEVIVELPVAGVSDAERADRG